MNFATAIGVRDGLVSSSLGLGLAVCGPGKGRGCWFGLHSDCAQDTRRIGQGFTVVSESIGAMVANCGLGQVKRITGPVGLPREFWAPA